ncbi:MAG TPA: TRAP transporter small permease [Candidatus Methylomirabilis sp.]|nr:TRAP transporter small permease [Candidatus Methylomirabilis sp.]
MTFWRVVDWLVDSLAAVLLLVMSLVLAVEVFFRYVLNRPLSWTLEVSLFCFVWLVWLGAVGFMREERQIRIDFVETYAPRSIKRYLLPANTALSLVFLLYVIYYGVQVMESQMSAVYDILPFSRGILYAAAPVGGSLMFLTLTRVLLRQIRRYSRSREA